MKLIKLKNDRFVILQYKNEIFCEDFKTLFNTSTHLGIPQSEMDFAICEMLANQHNVAEFGDINASFLFTKELEN